MTNNIVMKISNEIKRFLKKQTPQTGRSYSWFLDRLDKWIQETGEDPVLLDPDSLTRFLDDQQTWGASTRRLATCATRAFYRFWQGSEHPILGASLRRTKTAPQRVLSPKKAIQLLASIDPSTTAGARDLSMVMLMLDTGLRESEIARLELRHVNLDERKLSVLVKGGDWGKAVFSAVTADHLDRWLVERNELRGKFASLPPHIFVNFNTGGCITASGIRKLFARLSERAGFTVSPHDLRRTFATIATKAGAPTRVLMAAGRWNNINQLETYTREIEPEDFLSYFPVSFLAGNLSR